MFVAEAERLVELSQPPDDGRAWAVDFKTIDHAAAGVENAQRRLT
jgi:hypothetical protein